MSPLSGSIVIARQIVHKGVKSLGNGKRAGLATPANLGDIHPKVRRRALVDDYFIFSQFQLPSLLGPDHHHRLRLEVGEKAVHVLLDVEVEVRLFLGLLTEPPGQQQDLLFGNLGLLQALLDLLVEDDHFLGRFQVHCSPDPLHFVLVDLLDVADPLEDVGDVIDSSLLDSQLAGGLVYIKYEVFLALDELHKPLGQDGEGVLPPGLLFVPLASLRAARLIQGGPLLLWHKLAVWTFVYALLFLVGGPCLPDMFQSLLGHQNNIVKMINQLAEQDKRKVKSALGREGTGWFAWDRDALTFQVVIGVHPREGHVALVLGILLHRPAQVLVLRLC